jgi:hypothetical protein
MTYQLTNGSTVIRLEDGAFIPSDSQNLDYIAFQKWLDEGNTPDPPAPSPPPGPDYQAFWDSLIESSVYASIREQSFTSLPLNTLATEFIALLGDAKNGRANVPAIQRGISAVLSAGSFTPDQLTEFRSALSAGHLDGTYPL